MESLHAVKLSVPAPLRFFRRSAALLVALGDVLRLPLLLVGVVPLVSSGHHFLL